MDLVFGVSNFDLLVVQLVSFSWSPLKGFILRLVVRAVEMFDLKIECD